MKLFKQPGSNNWWAAAHVKGKRRRKSMGTADRRKAEKKGKEWIAELERGTGKDKPDIQLKDAVESFLTHCQKNGLAKKTISGYRYQSQRFVVFLGKVDITSWSEEAAQVAVDSFLAWLKEDLGLVSVSGNRLCLSTLFNYFRAKRWYRGRNPAEAKLHNLRKPRKGLKVRRCTNREEDLIIRREGSKTRIWPILMLTRWAGMRRGEVCALHWGDVNLAQGYADVVGRDGGRKHARRVWLAPWVVLQLRSLQPQWTPGDGSWPLWPFHPDTATDFFADFCKEHLERRVTYTDLRASFVTECQARGITPTQESSIVGHSIAVAEKHYSEYEAKEARGLLPPDPLADRPTKKGDAGSDADLAATTP